MNTDRQEIKIRAQWLVILGFSLESAVCIGGSRAYAANPVEAAVQATDTTLPLSERLAALNTVVASSGSDRSALLKQILREADEAVAIDTARVLFTTADSEAVEILASRIRNWSSYAQAAVLAPLWRSPSLVTGDELAALMRPILLARRDAASPCEDGELYAGDPMFVVSGSSLDQAAIMLGTISRRSADRRLVGEVARRVPCARGLWLAMAENGPVSQEELHLARTIYEDPAHDGPLRLAAAVAAAPTDPNAEVYVAQSLEDVFSRIDRGATSRPTAMTQPADFVASRSFYTSIAMLSMVRFLHSTSSHEWAFRCARARTREVAQVGMQIAAYRWPEEFIAVPKDRVAFDDLWEVFVAYTVFNHQELRAAAIQMLPEERLEPAIEHIRKRGALLASQHCGAFPPPTWDYLLGSE